MFYSFKNKQLTHFKTKKMNTLELNNAQLTDAKLHDVIGGNPPEFTFNWEVKYNDGFSASIGGTIKF